jgi:Fe-S oxidoreductase
LALYHTRYRRPVLDYFVAALETLLPMMALAPKLANLGMKAPWSKGILEKWIGLVDTPPLSELRLEKELEQRGAPAWDPERLLRLNEAAKQKSVLLLQDAFTSFYESHVVLACYDLLTRLGFTVYVLPFRQNGKGLHIKGFLKQFHQVVHKNSAFLEQAARTGIDIVGIDPAVVLTYRDEYREVLGGAASYRVELVQEWLSRQLPILSELRAPDGTQTFQLFGHCTERTAEPSAEQQWKLVFSAFGVALESIQVGCCGMCGVYGHEASHRVESEGVFRMSWGKALPADEGQQQRVLASGHSCRSQVKRFAGFVPRHPLEALEELTRPKITGLPRT